MDHEHARLNTSAGADAFFAKLGEMCARLKDEGGLGILVNNVGMVNAVGLSVYLGVCSSYIRLGQSSPPKHESD